MATVTIEIPDQLERDLRALEGVDQIDLSDVVLKLVQQSVSTRAPSPNEISVEEWQRRFHAWVASRPNYGVIADCDRETIYEGRGE